MGQRGKSIGGLLMEVEDNRRVILSGCKGILTYSEECVRMRAARGGAVAIYGQRLEMGCMSADGAAVCGRIQRIEFEEQEGV